MKNTKNYYLIAYFISLLLLINSPIHASNESYKNNKSYNWKQISGNWKLYHKHNFHYLYNTKSQNYDFGYSELINRSSIISKNILNRISKIETEFETFNARKNSQFMIFFSAKSFRTFYAFRFTGDNNNLNKIALIKSSVKDTTKPPHIKWNFEIKELNSKKIKLSYSQTYKVRIELDKNRYKLFVDNQELISGEINRKFPKGKLGFSHEYNLLRIGYIKAYSKEKLVFEDDFSKNSIYRTVIHMKRTKKKDLKK